MDTGSADDTALSQTHQSRSGNTRPFETGSPMAKKIRKKELERLANGPAEDTELTQEIPPTEPRPTLLNFETNIANIAPLRSAPTDHNEKTKATAPTRSASLSPPQTPLPLHSNTQAPPPNMQHTPHHTPSYLQTTTTNTALSLDTIIDTVLGSYVSPDALLTPKIKSFFDVLAEYSKRYPESNEAISPNSCSETWRREFHQYYSMFKSRNQWLDEPATVALLARIATLSPAARLVVQKAWMRGAGLSAADSYNLAARIKSFGEMGDRQATYEDLSNINFDGLAAITTEALCNTGSSCDATDQTLCDLSAMNVVNCRNLQQLLAMELGLWEACHRELDGPPMATYLRLNNLKAACGRDQIWRELIEAFDDITSRDKNIKISKVKAWSTIESRLSDAWDLACNQGMLKRLDHPVDYKQIADLIDDDSSIDAASDSSEHSPGLSAHPSFLPRKNNKGTFEGKAASDLKDQQLPCKGCKKPFTDSVEDQAHRVAQGWIHPPARCPPCKASYLEALSKNPQHCNDFKSGNCAYGDKCRYSHELPLVSMHIAMDDESSDDLDLDCY